MDKIRVGERMKELRKKEGLSLSELATSSGVQIATLSRIEHDTMTGTVEAHAKIAYTLNTSLSDFYRGIKIESNPIKAPVEGKSLKVITQGDVSSQLLTSDVSSKKLLPTLLTIKPYGKSTLDRTKFSAEEFVYMLQGTITVTVEDKTYKLSKGNTFYFNANEPHQFKNLSKIKAKLICVRTQ